MSQTPSISAFWPSCSFLIYLSRIVNEPLDSGLCLERFSLHVLHVCLMNSLLHTVSEVFGPSGESATDIDNICTVVGMVKLMSKSFSTLRPTTLRSMFRCQSPWLRPFYSEGWW